MANIVMLLSNAYRPDVRVQKEASSLAEAGHTVTLICWDRRGELKEDETLPNGVHVKRLQSIRSVYGAGIKQILYTPRFWLVAIKMVLPLKPDLVYCRDLDTLYAGVSIKKQLRCKLLLDAHEDYPSFMSLYLPGIFVQLLAWWQDRLLRHVDAAIAASSVTTEKLAAAGVSPAVHIPNTQELNLFENISREQVDHARRVLGLHPDSYVVSYIGGFSRNRLLLPLIEAMHSLADATLLLAGDGHQRLAVEEAIKGISNVRYLGWISLEEVPVYTYLSDVIYYCLKPDYPGAIYNSPNTLFNAMAAGRPVIANNLGDLGRIVEKTGCGLLLEEVTPQTIATAIRKLSDKDFRRKLGEAGHTAAKNEYNWQVVKGRLLDLCKSLLPTA